VLVVAAATGIDSNSSEVEAVFPGEASEVVPILAAIHLVYQRQFLEAEPQDEDPEAEEVRLKRPLGGAVAAAEEGGV
jgi:hypothetical protein